MIGPELSSRRHESAERFRILQDSLTTAREIVADKACIYATGSFGRGEASPHSDLDLFIVGRDDTNKKLDKDGFRVSQLTNLEEIRVKADLIVTAERLGFPAFSGDGRYVSHYSLSRLTKTLGTPEDDSTNTLTARLLLLLESRPIVGDAEYEFVLKAVISAYWRDFEGHEMEFMPAFIVNDILRLWRTFCVNYEARITGASKERAKLQNYKLKNSRLLTCFSAVAELISCYVQNSTVAPAQMLEIVRRTPSERLESLISASTSDAVKAALGNALRGYERFLNATNRPEADQLSIFADKSKSSELLASARVVGDSMFEAILAIGSENNLLRRLVV
jgi:hypothetical protein